MLKIGKIIIDFTFESLVRASVERTARLALDAVVHHFYISENVNNVDQARLPIAQLEREPDAHGRVQVDGLHAAGDVDFIAVLGVLKMTCA